jgi:hypothetical protein
MSFRTPRVTAVVCLAIVTLSSAASGAEKRPFAPVPPALEIEILDPGVDPLGNPAVLLERAENGEVRVDIPPVVLVHRYYYSGDRSFQGPMLPGGPSIVVVNHPKTGERCYIPVQMMPGAPRVTYTAHGIEYDYGANGTTISFGLFGKPKVTYRTGTPWKTRLEAAVHADQWRQTTQKVHAGTKSVAKVAKDSLTVAAIDGKELAKTATLPVCNVLRMMPLGAAITDPDRATKWAEKVAEHKRQHEVEHAAKLAERDDITIKTNR